MFLGLPARRGTFWRGNKLFAALLRVPGLEERGLVACAHRGGGEEVVEGLLSGTLGGGGGGGVVTRLTYGQWSQRGTNTLLITCLHTRERERSRERERMN